MLGNRWADGLGGGAVMSDLTKLTGVYQIRNLLNGKLYVGSAAQNFWKRWSSHRGRLNKGNHHSIKLQRAWNKHGEARFVFEVLLVCDSSECLSHEQTYLNKLGSALNGYNVCPVAGSLRGTKRSDEVRAKISTASKNITNETREKMSAAAKRNMTPERRAKISSTARNISEETRAKMRAAKQNISDETRAKMSACRKGKKLSDETRQRMSVARKGVKRSPEAVAKTAAGNTGMRHSQETIAKMSIDRKGRIASDETRAKLSASTKRIWEARRNKLATHQASNKDGDL